MNILDLGCGPNKVQGAFGVDLRPFPGVNLVADLNVHPYPIEDDRFDVVYANHIAEHLDDVQGFFSEIHRVAKHGATVVLETPHFSNRSAYADPTHRHAFSARYLDFFCGSKPRSLGIADKAGHYLFEHRFVFEPFDDPPKFTLASRRLTFSRIFRSIGIEAFANRFLDFYEFYLAFLFPARDILAKLKVSKEDR